MSARSALAFSALLALAASPASAQGSYRLEIDRGVDVRFSTRASPEQRLAGRVLGVVGDTLLLEGGASRRYPLADLARLELRGGRDRRRGVTIGALAGSGITAVAGGIDAGQGQISVGEVVGAALLNAVIGGVIGHALAPGGWERLALPRR